MRFGCQATGKVKHSRSEALRVLAEQSRFDPDPANLSVYRCRHCSRWHLGHKSGPWRALPQAPIDK